MSNITIEKWKVDVENTRAEIAAYDNLANGYDTLARLPENKGNSTYPFRANANRRLHKECAAFLVQIISYGKGEGWYFDFEQPSGIIGNSDSDFDVENYEVG